MPTVTGFPVNETEFFTDYQFRVEADPGTQLRSFNVMGNGSLPITVEPPVVPCTTDVHECTARRLRPTQFPLAVSVEICDDDHLYGPDEFPLFGAPPGTSGDGPIEPVVWHCSSVFRFINPPCELALSRAQRARTRASLKCSEVNSLRREFRTLLAAAAFYSAAFLLLAALAAQVSAAGGWIGAIIAAVLFAAAGVMFTLAGIMTRDATRKRLELTAAESELRGLQRQFSAALEEVDERCCPSDIGINRNIPCGDTDVFGHSVLPGP